MPRKQKRHRTDVGNLHGDVSDSTDREKSHDLDSELDDNSYVRIPAAASDDDDDDTNVLSISDNEDNEDGGESEVNKP